MNAQDRGAEPAYPVANRMDRYGDMLYGADGLTKREAFAMAAMQGLLANGTGNYALPDRAASMAVVVADLLLAALNQEPRT